MSKWSFVIVVLLAFVAGWFVGGRKAAEKMVEMRADTVVTVDTVRIIEPVEVTKTVVRTVTAPMALASAVHDTVYVQVPIERHEYEGDGYRAYVSGWESRLDSIVLARPTTTVKVSTPSPPPRVSFGLQGGVGLTPKGIQPYIGVGVSVRL